jgi:SAM-dependent methyltransferase
MHIKTLLRRWGLRYWRTRHGWTVGVGTTQFFVRRTPASSPGAGWLTYRCNICGRIVEARPAEMGRETISCWQCGSTVRFRAVIHTLSQALFGRSLILSDFPTRDLRGLGLSDWEGYAGLLEDKLAYKNTYYHRAPRLDITEIDAKRAGTLDFLIASDVFEHVPPPVSVAFENAYRLLKPGGALIFTSPYVESGETVEHFPELFTYKIIHQDGSPVLENVTRTGEVQRFETLRFHGGPGASLEMRRFSKPSLLAAFAQAGFSEVEICHAPCFDYGIVWLTQHSYPILARK